ncbi:GNAT family N-acetyltransferase [Chitinophaga qingshengii]|uniref:GNAT family N-acetyltransferase n=1 Tax=Chitinophaga qingshengii TaxID=1569794 RepID=A0ABR7TKI9_9BACT|nr:GNAT family N-acetyltransferase [Chitinophaga qingshengii]MBC9929939.1 GNAT family N-acetyltransferase [Chitinophaga qingshengii]
MRTVKIATTDAEIMACAEVILVLRPHIAPENLLPQIKEMQQEGYHLLYLTTDEDPATVAAIAGYRHKHNLHSGRFIYIDDLATHPSCRAQGYASLLLYHIREIALLEGLSIVQLDSGHGLWPAHRLYHEQGFYISAHHFTQKV